MTDIFSRESWEHSVTLSNTCIQADHLVNSKFLKWVLQKQILSFLQLFLTPASFRSSWGCKVGSGMLPQHNPSLCSPHLGRSSPGVVKSTLGWQNPNCPECWEAPAAGEDAAGDSAGPARCSHQPSCTPDSQNQSHSREKTPPRIQQRRDLRQEESSWFFFSKTICKSIPHIICNLVHAGFVSGY